MRFPRLLLPLAVLGAVACGPTYVVQSAPQPAPQRVPEQPPPPRVPPLEVSVVRPEDGRVLVQTSRAAYVAVFEMVPGRGVSLVYPQPMRPRDVMLTGLNWVPVYWTMHARFASNDTRYIYTVASDTPLLLPDEVYDARYLQQRLGSTFWASAPNATARAISREFVRAQPDEWWGEDMYSVPLRDGRMEIIARIARVYCPGGVTFEVREDLADHIWCPERERGSGRRGEHPVASEPDSVFSSIGRRIPRHVDPTNRTPIFRVPTPTDVGQQQGHPINQPPQAPPRTYPREQPQPQSPTVPAQNQPQQPPPGQNPPPQTPPQTQPPQNQPQTQPGQPTPNDPNGDNGRRAHGDPRNADPRGNGNGYGNGGRTTSPSTQPPASTPPQSNPQPQQQGNGNNGANNGNANGNANNGNANNGNHGNGNNGNGDNGKSPNDAKPGHDAVPVTRQKGAAAVNSRLPGAKKQDDKKTANDSTDTKKKP